MKIQSTCVLAGLCFFASLATVRAQAVLGSASSAPLVPSSLRGTSPFSLPGSATGNAFVLLWGPVEISPYVSDQFVYSDGIQSAPGHPANSYINSLSAGVKLDLGSHWTLDYTPSWVIYTSRAFQNSLNQSLNLAAGYEVGDWLGQFSQTYSDATSTRPETARQTRQQSASTSFTTSHRFTDHLSIQLGMAQSLQFIDASPDSYDWSTQDALVYRPGSRLELSINYRLGYTDFDPGAYMTYAQPSAQVRWRVTDKLALSLQGGHQYSQIHKTGIASTGTPTWSASMQYQPFDHTALTFGASRSFSPSSNTSLVMNSVSDSQGLTAAIEQRLLGRLNLSAGISVMKTHYSGTETVLVPNIGQEDVFDTDGNVIGTIPTLTFSPATILDLRDDSTHAFNMRLGTTVLKRATLALLYERSRNISDTPGFSYTSHQIGCDFGYRW